MNYVIITYDKNKYYASGVQIGNKIQILHKQILRKYFYCVNEYIN